MAVTYGQDGLGGGPQCRRPRLQASIRDHESVIPSLRASIHLLKIEIIITRLDCFSELCKLIGLACERTIKTLKNWTKQSLCIYIDRKHRSIHEKAEEQGHSPLGRRLPWENWQDRRSRNSIKNR